METKGSNGCPAPSWTAKSREGGSGLRRTTVHVGAGFRVRVRSKFEIMGEVKAFLLSWSDRSFNGWSWLVLQALYRLLRKSTSTGLLELLSIWDGGGGEWLRLYLLVAFGSWHLSGLLMAARWMLKGSPCSILRWDTLEGPITAAVLDSVGLREVLLRCVGVNS